MNDNDDISIWTELLGSLGWAVGAMLAVGLIGACAGYIYARLFA